MPTIDATQELEPAGGGGLREAALEYAGRGLQVIPLHSPGEHGCSCGRTDCASPGKHPRTMNGLRDASTDSATVLEWWARWPTANVGIVTGAASGIIALDVDTPKGGAGTLARLERQHGKLPKVPQVLTGSGGGHHYFAYPGHTVKNSAGTLGSGLDVRGDGGYLVAPPSVHACGRVYQWVRAFERAELVAPPAWLLEDAAKRANGAAPPIAAMIPQGRRRQELLSLAGTMRRRGMVEVEIVAALVVVNETRCDPPLARHEVEEIARDVCARYAPDPAAAARVEPLVADTPRERSVFLPLARFASHEYPPATPLLGREDAIFLAVGSLMMVYGAEGAGKSTFAADLGCHLASGRDWLGIPVPAGVRVLFVENEGPAALFQSKLIGRVLAWDGPTDWHERVHVHSAPWGEFSFADPGAREELVAYCDQFEIDVVIANPTLGLGVAGSGRPDETQAFVDWLVDCGLKTHRAFVLLHHENKAGQISGDWGRHPDTKVQLAQDGNRPRTKLTWSKTRWATIPSAEYPARTLLLDWDVERHSYNLSDVDLVAVADDELQERLDDFLRDNPGSSTSAITETVRGSASRLRELLKNCVAEGRYGLEKGPRGAKLHSLGATPSPRSEDGVDGVA